MWLPLLALLAAATPAQAPTAGPDHDPQRLTRLLAAHDYLALTRTFNAPRTPIEVKADLDWQRDRLINDGSALVGIWYATDLWRVGEATPAERDGLRETAVLATLYSYGAILIDGARCADQSAVGHRIDQVAAANPALWTFARTLPIERRRKIISLVLLTDQRTAAPRAAGSADDFVCRGGLDETTYNLERGTQREVKTPPGGVGRTIELTGDGKYRPKLAPPATAQAAAARTRAELPKTLGRLIDMAM